MIYVQDTDLQDVANHIIATHRPGLTEVKICYMFRETAPVSQDKCRAGCCVRVDDRNHAIHKYDFVIEIGKDVWSEASGEFRNALMDHELGHIGIRRDEDGAVVYEDNGRIKTFCNMHDIEEFSDVLERHGGYHKNLRVFLTAFARRKAKKEKGKKRDEGTIEEA